MNFKNCFSLKHRKRRLSGAFAGVSLGLALSFGPTALAATEDPDSSPIVPANAPIEGTHTATISPEKMQQRTESFIQSLPQLGIPRTSESLDRVTRLEAEGEKSFADKAFDKALTKWQQAYEMCVDMKDSSGEGRALTNMCRIYIARGQFIKAKYLGENAIEVLGGVNDKRAMGRAHLYLGEAYFGLQNSTWGAAELDTALKLFTSGSTNESAGETATILHIAGNMLMEGGRMKEGLQYLEQAAVYSEQAGDHAAAVTDHANVARVMDTHGLYVAAYEEALKGAEIAKNNPEQRGLLVTANTAVANAEYYLGDFANARRDLESVIALAKQLPPASIGDKARGNIDLGYGFCLAGSGDRGNAKVCLERALPALQKAQDMSGQAAALNALGVIATEENDFTKAFSYFSRCSDLLSVMKPPDNRLHIYVLQNLAAAHSRNNDNRQAKQYLDQAMQMCKKDPSKVLRGRVISALAEVCLKLTDIQAAEELLRQGIALSESIKDDAALWRDYALLAKIQVAQQQLPAAKESINSSLSHFRSPQAGVFASPTSLTFPSARKDFGEQLVSLVSKYGAAEQALMTAEQLKEEAFSSEWHGWGGQVKPEDKDVYLDLVSQRAHLHSAEMISDPSLLIGEWQRWMARYKTLVTQNRSLAKLVAPIPMSMADVMKTVQGRHQTVIEYLVGHTSSVVFTIDPNGRISATVLPNTGRKLLDTQVSEVLAPPPAGEVGSEQAHAHERATLQALHRELLPQAVRGFLPPADQTVVVVPDGPLFNLPFAALIDDQGKFFIQEHTLTMAPSLAALMDSPPRYADNFSVLIASPAASDSAILERVLQPESLTKMVGKDADIDNLQDSARGKSVVHFTSSVVLAPGNPTRSVLPLSSSKGEVPGKVTADRLFGLNLPNDLMVMSGTSVTTKDSEGHGVQALSRGLNYAGVRNLMMSLWLTSDPSRTSELLDFYKFKQEGLNQAQSLRKAELLALARNPLLRSWAAFQLIGPGN